MCKDSWYRNIWPKCPYCGREMVYCDSGMVGFYVCPKCDSRSPGVGGFSSPISKEKRPIEAAEKANSRYIDGNTSDGYHTFNELYDHRAKLFSVIVRSYSSLCWKSKHHHDGTMYDGMFIVGIDTPEGQATYHYDIDPYWDLFDCKELDSAPEWDGHTPQQAVERIRSLPAKLTRVLSLPEISNREEPFWVEYKEDWFPKGWFALFDRYDNHIYGKRCGCDGSWTFDAQKYGSVWRAWDGKPTLQERAAHPWEGDSD